MPKRERPLFLPGVADCALAIGLREEVTRGLLESLSQPVSLFIRVNSIKISAPALAEALAREGVEAEQVTSFPQTLSIKKTGPLPSLASFREGLFHVQDLSSQFAAQQLGAKAGERVIDVCAAPGGKTFTIAEEMQNEGKLLAFDKYRRKVRLIADGAKRLGLSIVQAHVRDAEHPEKPLMEADRVLCDAPCSGLGIIRRKPEIRYRKKTDLDSLPDLQYRILCEASPVGKTRGADPVLHMHAEPRGEWKGRRFDFCRSMAPSVPCLFCSPTVGAVP